MGKIRHVFVVVATGAVRVNVSSHAALYTVSPITLTVAGGDLLKIFDIASRSS